MLTRKLEVNANSEAKVRDFPVRVPARPVDLAVVRKDLTNRFPKTIAHLAK
jgi:hypothetical protein